MRFLRIGLLVMALAVAALIPVAYLHAQGTTECPPDTGAATTATPAAATTTTTRIPRVSARTVTNQGREVGEVLVADTVALRLTGSVGGFTPGERAQIVASRLTNALTQGYTWQDVRTERAGNQVLLYMGNTLLVTADPGVARAQGTTPTRLASQWQSGIQTAVRNAPATVVVAGSEETWPAWTNVGNKIVPIISAGSPGVRLGAAQVVGPQERVDEVESVVQLDLVFQNAARIRVFVPSSTLTGLNRVQGTAVQALLEYGLFEF